MKKEATYKKICKKRHMVRGFDALWSGGDHLLLVCNNMYVESYKRFFFADIQALHARVTKHSLYLSFFLVCCLLFCLLCAFLSDEPLARYVFLGTGGLFFLALLINLLQGPSCEATVVTRVQSHSLPIGRLKKARKVFAALRARIEEVQGVFNAEELNDASEIFFPGQGARRASRENVKPSLRQDAGRPATGHSSVRAGVSTVSSYGGVFHLLYSAVLLIIAGLNGLQLYVRHEGIVILEMILFVSGLLFMVLALARQKNSALPWLLKKNTWVALCFIFILLGLSYVDMLGAFFENVGEVDDVQTQLVMLEIYANRDPDTDGFFKFLLLAHAVSLSVVGVFGLWQTSLFQLSQKKQGQEVESQ